MSEPIIVVDGYLDNAGNIQKFDHPRFAQVDRTITGGTSDRLIVDLIDFDQRHIVPTELVHQFAPQQPIFYK